jgi:hypothetical protein
MKASGRVQVPIPWIRAGYRGPAGRAECEPIALQPTPKPRSLIPNRPAIEGEWNNSESARQSAQPGPGHAADSSAAAASLIRSRRASSVRASDSCACCWRRSFIKASALSRNETASECASRQDRPLRPRLFVWGVISLRAKPQFSRSRSARLAVDCDTSRCFLISLSPAGPRLRKRISSSMFGATVSACSDSVRWGGERATEGKAGGLSPLRATGQGLTFSVSLC